ncbi:hypothetical protein [Skermania piniformis]|uniref:Uncharacterized protein n=1 Tax=Skermania pinensis TaxID=39122 RepID=A0ABX8SAI2_9ACTN|nr:hypothetical protein [Skermania piniformis]QXQ14864.1 hypothetical protein KV203_05635 [Skermania piniformis]
MTAATVVERIAAVVRAGLADQIPDAKVVDVDVDQLAAAIAAELELQHHTSTAGGFQYGIHPMTPPLDYPPTYEIESWSTRSWPVDPDAFEAYVQWHRDRGAEGLRLWQAGSTLPLPDHP